MKCSELRQNVPKSAKMRSLTVTNRNGIAPRWRSGDIDATIARSLSPCIARRKAGDGGRPRGLGRRLLRGVTVWACHAPHAGAGGLDTMTSATMEQKCASRGRGWAGAGTNWSHSTRGGVSLAGAGGWFQLVHLLGDELRQPRGRGGLVPRWLLVASDKRPVSVTPPDAHDQSTAIVKRGETRSPHLGPPCRAAR